MSSTPSPTWYDVLGVSRDSTPEEIKAAWRAATDKFEPGSGSGGQFRMFNEAADVLLDPARRAAYDDTLEATTDDPLVPGSSAADTVLPAAASASTVQGDRTEQPDPVVAYTEKAKPRRIRKPSSSRAPASRRARMLLAVLALLTVAAIVLAVVLGLKVRTQSRVADARDEAPAAAERAAKAVLAYDYKTLPADRKRASVYLTDGFKKKYLANFTLLEKQKDGTPGAAVQTKTVVTSSVLGSGVMDAQADLVRVLVYVNQVSTRPGRDPQIFQNRAAVTMKKVGDRWLVDNLKSY
jgi:Mce-associated membrane protein